MPPELLALAFGSKLQYIGQAETLAAAAAYHTFPAVLDQTSPIHFVDNQGSLSALVGGHSRDAPTSWLANDLATFHYSRATRVWFEWVASAANISDLPSRGDLVLAARLLRERFRHPVHWCARVVLPRLRAARALS